MTSFFRYALILALFSAPMAHAGEPWDTTDKVLGATAASLLVVDWGQTLYIADNPDKYYERNIIMGEHPSRGQVNVYFATVLVGGYFFADWLSPDNRKRFLGTVSVIEVWATTKNHGIGVRIGF